VCVCLSVATITKKIVDGFVPNFMGRFLGEKERPSSCFVTIDKGMWKLRSKNSANGDCLHFILLIVGVAGVAKRWRQNPPNFAIG